MARNAETLACFVFVVIGMAFGGGPGDLGVAFFIIAIAGLTLALAAIRGRSVQTFQTLPLIMRLSIVLAATLPLIQLIPLPPAIWHLLPGHGLRVAVLQSFGLSEAWMPLSVTPVETAYSAVIGLSMLALFVTVIAMPQDRVRALIVVVVSMIGIGIIIGILQLASGGGIFQFHTISHRDALTGFFANKNHMGLTLACLVPLSIVLVEHQISSARAAMVLLGLGWIALIALLIATNSRAGLLLGLIGMVLSSAHLFPHYRIKVMIGVVLAAVIGVALASTVPEIQSIIDRFGQVVDDGRLDILDQGIPLIDQYGALGAGIGSFASVYAPTELLEWVNPYYVNHLHNDWLQFVIEAGLPGVVVLLTLTAAIFVAGRAMWPRIASNREKSVEFMKDELNYAWAGMVIIFMFALHSFGDYPIRRVAALTLLVVALALVFRLSAKPGGAMPADRVSKND